MQNIYRILFKIKIRGNDICCLINTILYFFAKKLLKTEATDYFPNQALAP